MTPEWVDFTGAFSAAVAAVLAGIALYFAWRAGRDLVHDRRDTFELSVLREIFDIVNNREHTKPHLRQFLRGQIPALEEYYEKHPMLWFETMQSNPGLDPEYLKWRSRELDRLVNSAIAEVLSAINRRTGQAGRS